MKTCTNCRENKDTSLFSRNKNSKDGLKAQCKACCKIYNDNWFLLNKTRKHEKAKWQHKRSKYGLSKESYFSMLESQSHKCKICDLPSSENLHDHLYVDHCHSTGVIRGLLCKACNTMLGHSRDSVEILESAIKYLNGQQTKGIK